MKFSCEKALLQAAINTASRAVASKSSLPALEGLLLEARDGYLFVTGYNMMIGIRTRFATDIIEEGSIVLNARLFGDIIRKLPDDVLVFSSNDTLSVSLKCGNADFTIFGLETKDFPELPDVEDDHMCTLKQNVLKTMIGGTSFAVSTNETRIIHTGSLFEIGEGRLTVVSVDGFRLALRRGTYEKLDGEAFSFVAPGSALNEVEKICGDSDDNALIILGSRHVQFEVGETQLICRRLEGEFLDYKKAIPRSNPIILSVDRRALIESIERVSVVINDKMKSPIHFIFDENAVRLSVKTANGEANDTCPLTGDGGQLEIGFNNRYLLDALRYSDSDEVRVELNTGITPAIIVPPDATLGEEEYLYMVLPVRLKTNN
jgi:DNA polymerase-3 subunit beta